MLTIEQEKEITELRERKFETKRITVEAMEDIIYNPYEVLDHGLLRVVDYMGTDSSVIQAARVSYGKGTKKVSDDQTLINYLMRHYHTTPFEMCEINIHVKLPIFVARQWIRHRTASVNEYSARYSILDKEFYIPTEEHMAAQSLTNRQGRGNILSHEQAVEVQNLLREDSERNYARYIDFLNEDDKGAAINPEKDGLARELARMGLSLNFYTQWYWKTNLLNFMRFLTRRADSHAQYEIRVYAEIMMDILKAWAPMSHAAFVEYWHEAKVLSPTMLKLIKGAIDPTKLDWANSGLTSREQKELQVVLGVN